MDESGHRQRRGGEPGPYPRAGQVGALGQPGERHAQRRAERHGHEYKQRGVDEQRADARAQRQRDDLRETGLDAGGKDEADRQQRESCD